MTAEMTAEMTAAMTAAMAAAMAEAMAVVTVSVQKWNAQTKGVANASKWFAKKFYGGLAGCPLKITCGSNEWYS